MTGWEYISVRVDSRVPLGLQGGVCAELRRLGRAGWEAFGITPPTPTNDLLEADYEVLLKRPLPEHGPTPPLMRDRDDVTAADA